MFKDNSGILPKNNFTFFSKIVINNHAIQHSAAVSYLFALNNILLCIFYFNLLIRIVILSDELGWMQKLVVL